MSQMQQMPILYFIKVFSLFVPWHTLVECGFGEDLIQSIKRRGGWVMKKRLHAGLADAFTAVALRSLFPANGVASFMGAGIPVGSKFFQNLDSSCLVNHLLPNARDFVECSRLCSNLEDSPEPSMMAAFLLGAAQRTVAAASPFHRR